MLLGHHYMYAVGGVNASVTKLATALFAVLM
jgi:hypothetical protein